MIGPELNKLNLSISSLGFSNMVDYKIYFQKQKATPNASIYWQTYIGK